MATTLRSHISRAGASLAVTGLVGLAMALVTATHVHADDDDGFSEALVTPQMTAKWWQWAYSIPVDAHPLRQFVPPEETPPPEFDPSSDFCMVGQHGEVWFLGGIFRQVDFEPASAPAQLETSSEAPEIDITRTCEIPLGKPILMPVLNAACTTAEEIFLDNLEGDEPLQERIASLEACARGTADEITTAEAEFGREDHPWPANVQRVRTRLPFFVHFPDEPIIDLGPDPDPNPSLAIADGWWALVKPDLPGTYVLDTFGDAPAFDFSLRIRYILTIVGDDDIDRDE